MTDLPIIFSAPMVRALADDRKTKTRRLLYTKRKIKNGRVPGSAAMMAHFPPPQSIGPSGFPSDIGVDEYWTLGNWQKVKPGDRLWVRENIRLASQGPGHTVGICYPADGPMGSVHFFDVDEHNLKRASITPCIHMPRWASRLTLTVTATKIERLNDISEHDCRGEGVRWNAERGWWEVPGIALPSGAPVANSTPYQAFACLWDAVHEVGAWQSNPYVVALTFTVHKCNIDALTKTEAA